MKKSVKSKASAMSGKPRRVPDQARSQATVNAIYEALPQVLAQLGETGLTTERIAQRAGVSIGTLYQYFANRDDLLVAWLAREREIAGTALTDTLTKAARQGKPLREAVATGVELLLLRLGGADPVQRELLRLAWTADNHQAMQPDLAHAAQRNAALLSTHDDVGATTDALTMWLCIRSVMGVIRAASLERSPWLGTPALATRLTDMVLALHQQEPHLALKPA